MLTRLYLAVTHAQLASWEYMTVIRDSADPTCSKHIVNSIASIDSIIQKGYFKKQLKSLFGLAGLEHDQDFVSLLEVCLRLVSCAQNYLTD